VVDVLINVLISELLWGNPQIGVPFSDDIVSIVKLLIQYSLNPLTINFAVYSTHLLYAIYTERASMKQTVKLLAVVS